MPNGFIKNLEGQTIEIVDAKARQDISDLFDITEYVEPKTALNKNGTETIPYRQYGTIVDSFDLYKDVAYTITGTITNAISKVVNMYIRDAADNTLTSKGIATGNTTYTWTFTPTSDYEGCTIKAYCTLNTSETLTMSISGGTDTPASSKRLDAIESDLHGNVLYGKKWVVVGDSFTNGGTYDDTISSGKYKGSRSLYHYLIGNRNNMNIVHFAEGGRTLCTPSTVMAHNCFSDVESTMNYTLVPTDADYITIWLGINDSKTESGEASVGSTPLGTIDDTTVNTFYGAWNVVLEYLLEHNPYAHIGIIVTNGCTGTNYPDAIRKCARKWGIAYLDLNADYSIPLMHRVNEKSDVCDRATELRKSAFWVSSTNGHPNAHAQAYQSTFIENWLRCI